MSYGFLVAIESLRQQRAAGLLPSASLDIKAEPDGMPPVAVPGAGTPELGLPPAMVTTADAYGKFPAGTQVRDIWSGNTFTVAPAPSEGDFGAVVFYTDDKGTHPIDGRQLEAVPGATAAVTVEPPATPATEELVTPEDPAAEEKELATAAALQAQQKIAADAYRTRLMARKALLKLAAGIEDKTPVVDAGDDRQLTYAALKAALAVEAEPLGNESAAPAGKRGGSPAPYKAVTTGMKQSTVKAAAEFIGYIPTNWDNIIAALKRDGIVLYADKVKPAIPALVANGMTDAEITMLSCQAGLSLAAAKEGIRASRQQAFVAGLNLRHVGSNMTEVHLGDKVILFSYNTPVAATIGDKSYKTEKKWSSTTSKHINKWLNGGEAEVKPQAFFDQLSDSEGAGLAKTAAETGKSEIEGSLTTAVKASRLAKGETEEATLALVAEPAPAMPPVPETPAPANVPSKVPPVPGTTGAPKAPAPQPTVAMAAGKVKADAGLAEVEAPIVEDMILPGAPEAAVTEVAVPAGEGTNPNTDSAPPAGSGTPVESVGDVMQVSTTEVVPPAATADAALAPVVPAETPAQETMPDAAVIAPAVDPLAEVHKAEEGVAAAKAPFKAEQTPMPTTPPPAGKKYVWDATLKAGQGDWSLIQAGWAVVAFEKGLKFDADKYTPKEGSTKVFEKSADQGRKPGDIVDWAPGDEQADVMNGWKFVKTVKVGEMDEEDKAALEEAIDAGFILEEDIQDPSAEVSIYEKGGDTHADIPNTGTVRKAADDKSVEVEGAKKKPVVKAGKVKAYGAEPIPKDHAVQPLKPGEEAEGKVTCGTCGLSWDDSKITSMTPAPSGRCPFEYFHIPDEEEEEEEVEVAPKPSAKPRGPKDPASQDPTMGVVSSKVKAGIKRLPSGKWKDTNGNSYATIEEAARAEAANDGSIDDRSIEPDSPEWEAAVEARAQEIIHSLFNPGQ